MAKKILKTAQINFNSFEECCSWVEMGWWTQEEACLALLDISPRRVNNWYMMYELRQNDYVQKVSDLIQRAVTDNQINNLIFEIRYTRAPCKSWIEWAKTKKSISINPNLIDALTDEIKRISILVVDEKPKNIYEQNLHSKVFENANKHLLIGDFRQAVQESAIAFENEVKKRSEVNESGLKLMSKAFSETGNLKLSQNPSPSETEKNEQQGLMLMAKGFMSGIRNPVSHETSKNWPVNEKLAMQSLSILSYLWDQLDKCVKTNN